MKRCSECIIIDGHAGYAEPGQDIVCAAVSALVQTLIQSIEDLTSDKITYDISPGWADIKHGNLSQRAKLLVDSFFVGVEMIANEYPYNVRIVPAWMTEKATEESAGVERLKIYGKQCESFKNRREKL